MNHILLMISGISMLLSSWILTCTIEKEDKLKQIIIFFATFGMNAYIGVMLLGFVIQKLNMYTLTGYHLIVLLLLGLFVWWKKIDILPWIKKKKTVSKEKHITWEKIILGCIILVFISLSIFKLIVMMNTRESSADGRNYHIPVLYDYIQKEKITGSEKVVWSEGYPKNMEMLNLWTLVFEPGGKILRTPQLFLALLGSLAVYCILKKQNGKSIYCALGSLCFFISPFVLGQTTTTYLDGSMISVFMIALYFMLEYLDKKKITNLVLMSILIGFMAGMKSSGIAYGAITVIFLFLYLLLIEKKKIKELIVPLFIAGGVIILFGGSFYIWNLIRFQNPLFPFKMLFFDGYDVNERIMIPMTPDIIKGKNVFYQVFYSWYSLPTNAMITSMDQSGTISRLINFSCDQRLGGMGAIWALVLFPSILLYSIIAIRKKKNCTKHEWLLIAIILTSFIITPASWWARYSGFIVLLGIIAFTKLMPEIKNKRIKTILLIGTVGAMSLTVVQGCYNDYYAYKYIEADAFFLKDINTLINQDRSLKILVFENVKEENYLLLQGSRGQNIVKAYYSSDDLKYISKYLDHYNVNTEQDIENILDKENDYDYILVWEKKDYFDKSEALEKVLESHLGNFYKKKEGETL